MRGIVTLYEAIDGHPNVLGQATTAANGSFTIDASKSTTTSIFYATAEVRGSVILMALIGPEIPGDITMNELTTVAAVYCAAQFLQTGQIRGKSFGLQTAGRMHTNLVYVDSGQSSPVLLSSPNGDESNTLRSTRALANLLAACVRNPGDCDTLFDLATPPNGARPADTIAAMYNIARYPANNVEALYTQSQVLEVYQPSLATQPDAWTLAVKVNDSGDDAQMFGGPANLKFDRKGRAWITNNVVQGTTHSTAYCMVLDPEGKPAVDDKGKRMSPFTGGGLWGAGFGVDFDRDGNVWIGNFGWGGDEWDPKPSGSVSKFTAEGQPLSPPEGYQDWIFKVQQTAVDPSGNVWMASYGNNRVVVYPRGDHFFPIMTEGLPNKFVPFGIAIAADGTAWVTNSATESSSVIHFELVHSALHILSDTKVGKTLKGVVVDSQGTVWVGSGGDDFVYALEPDGTLIGGFDGGGVSGPWGLGLDGDDNVWVANFGALRPGDIFSGRLTQLAGANPATRPPGTSLGDPISPATGYTLPSAGAEVLLHDGTPLYAGDGPPCFEPMMRTTGLNVDAAGNVWTCNNWKPSFDIDRDTNPGGDGMVIFIGLAKPLPR
jgi:hypothetical protein